MTAQPKPQRMSRQQAMAVLARAHLQELEHAWRSLPSQDKPQMILPPQAGLVMVQGRAGGSGQAFNLGEMSMTRCVLSLAGAQGHAYVAGRQLRLAELAACFDALWQAKPELELEKVLLKKLQARQQQDARKRSQKANSTRVDFFTLVRGDNAK